MQILYDLDLADAAAAEVFVRGCCSSLNRTAHHLASSEPPPLVTSMRYRAEIMSQTVQNGDIKTRILFCNTLGCNNKRIPWSPPVPFSPVVDLSNVHPTVVSDNTISHRRFRPKQVTEVNPVSMQIMDTARELEEQFNLDPGQMSIRPSDFGQFTEDRQQSISLKDFFARQQPQGRGRSRGRDREPLLQPRTPSRHTSPPTMPFETPITRRQSIKEEEGLVALLERIVERSEKRKNENSRPVLDLGSVLKAMEESRSRDSQVLVEIDAPRTSTSTFRTTKKSSGDRNNALIDLDGGAVDDDEENPQYCECHCNCPSLVCPTYQISSAVKERKLYFTTALIAILAFLCH